MRQECIPNCVFNGNTVANNSKMVLIDQLDTEKCILAESNQRMDFDEDLINVDFISGCHRSMILVFLFIECKKLLNI